ncbi:MAG: hypothetical protein F8N39_08475 [Clostridiaceae bacterium]|nr:hypothetical protein [Clostridiaceae bacterium]
MAKQSNNFSKEFNKIFKGNLGFEEQVNKVKETIESISKSQIKINNNQALKNISETQKALNQIKQNVVIAIGAKNTAKESINNIKKDLKSMVNKPFTVIIGAKNKTKKVIDGIKNTVFGKNSKKIFNSTIGEAMKREDKFASNSNGATNTASAQIKNIKESFAGLGANLVGVKDDGQIEKGGAFDTFKQQLSKILPLLDAFKKSDAFKVIQKDLNNLVAGAGSKFSALIEKLMKDPDKLKKQFDKLSQSIHSGISVIVKLGSTLTGLITKLKPLFDMMAKHPKTVIGLFAAFKIGIPIISSIVAAFAKFNAIKENLNTLKNSIKLFCDGSRSILTGFFKLIAANPVVAAILAIIVVAVLLYEAWKSNWGGIRDKTKIVIDFVKERINSIIEVFARVQESVNKFVEYISSKWSDLTFVFSHPIDAIVNIKETGTVRGKKKEGNNALGTSYWHGGWTWVENCPAAEKLAA